MTNNPPFIPARKGGLVIVGTAGHIDHGKTTLKSLTSVDTDSLEEEKRGISINIGFAYLSTPMVTDWICRRSRTRKLLLIC